MRNKTKEIAAAGVFCAFAYVLTNIGNVIPIRFAGFLSFDPKDAMIVMAGFALGPGAVIGITLACALLELITISDTGIIGFIMNVISSLCFALIPALIYKKRPSFRSAIFALVGSSCLTVMAMLLWNALVTPIYMHVPREAVIEMLIPVFLPFNVIKCVMNVIIVLCLYKTIIRVLRKIKLISPRRKDAPTSKEEGAQPIISVSEYTLKPIAVCKYEKACHVIFALPDENENE